MGMEGGAIKSGNLCKCLFKIHAHYIVDRLMHMQALPIQSLKS